MREEVKKFAEEMESVLKENDYKGGWDRCSISWLEKRLIKEVGEYAESSMLVDDEGDRSFEQDRKKELVDIANFCMMLHSRLDKICVRI